MLIPETAGELAETLREAAQRGQRINLIGNGSKRLMAGPVEPADIDISTVGLNAVHQYEHQDLTTSVGAGTLWRDFSRMLAQNRQMVPLDPPFSDSATVGGVVAANTCGPRRRLYGAARDFVIGMQFVTLEGKTVQSGGMVVKNVAGLDMGKLMIGSFGTLAAITAVNFKVLPAPEIQRSFLLSFESAGAAIQARNQILASALQPAALDLLNPATAATIGNHAWTLAIHAGGNRAAVERYEHELAELGDGLAFEGDRHQALWRYLREFTPQFLEAHANGAVVRASCTLKELEAVIAAFEGPAIARAGSGVCYGYFEQCISAAAWTSDAASRGWKCVVEYAPAERKSQIELWPAPGGDLELMQRVKDLFDPRHLLNRGRLYRRI